ncbi:MAG: FecR domain-containing protein [candidate division KSB1 bacterium]|nr:FecR domain-containing protein [candidate division KSB1 bacterium]
MAMDNSTHTDDYYFQLCSKSLTDSISRDERAELDVWLKQSVEHQRCFDELEKVWGETDSTMPPDLPDLDHEWRTLSRSLGIGREKELHSGSVSSFIQRLFNPVPMRARWVISAAVLVLAVSAVLYFKSPAPRILTVTTRSVEKEYVLLPDQSKVWLNSNSELSYPERFVSTREIQLTGEAFFVVVPDAKPFLVHTANAQARVLGTAFNVWSRDRETRVIVKRGKVELTRSNQDTAKVQLVRNETSRIEKEKAARPPQFVDADYAIGWMEGRLVFIKTPVAEILNELERFYGVEIQLLDSDLAHKTVTATFENKTLETVLTSLSLSVDCEFHEYDTHIKFGSMEKRPS